MKKSEAILDGKKIEVVMELDRDEIDYVLFDKNLMKEKDEDLEKTIVIDLGDINGEAN